MLFLLLSLSLSLFSLIGMEPCHDAQYWDGTLSRNQVLSIGMELCHEMAQYWDGIAIK